MTTIRYNKRNSFAIPWSGGELVLFPGVNLAVPDRAAQEIKAHPICKALIESDVIEFLTRTQEPHLEIEGIPVLDRPDEPVPAMPVGDRSAAKSKAAKDK